MSIDRKDIQDLSHKVEVVASDWIVLLDSADANQLKKTEISGLPGVSLKDSDGNTMVQVEESLNDDTIRFDTAGTERMIIESGGSVIIAANAGSLVTTSVTDDGDGNDVEITTDNATSAKFTVYVEEDGFDFISRFHSIDPASVVKGIRVGSRPSGAGTYLDLGVDAANSEAGFAIGAAFDSSDIIGEADLTNAALVFDANNDVRINNQLAIGTSSGDSTSTTLSISGANASSSGLWFMKSGDADNIFSIVQSESQLQFHHQPDVSSGWTTVGFISSATGEYYDNISFTGQHRMACSPGLLDSNYIGLIASSKGIYNNISGGNKPTINDALPEVELSTIRSDKRVYGVISNIEDSESREFVSGRFVSHFKKEDDDRLIINSLGEGGIWVCNINGDLENGDYITTCEIPGHGMRQDDDLLHNYSVAKITCDCNFDLNSNIYDCIEFEFNGQIYKKAFVGCTYHCG